MTYHQEEIDCSNFAFKFTQFDDGTWMVEVRQLGRLSTFWVPLITQSTKKGDIALWRTRDAAFEAVRRWVKRYYDSESWVPWEPQIV
jgi:hypothetical protein